MVNGHRLNVPSALVSEGDTIVVREASLKKEYFKKLKDYLSASYEITDAQAKFNTLLIEFRSANFPKRLKIEIRKELKECDFQEKMNQQLLNLNIVLKETSQLN